MEIKKSPKNIKYVFLGVVVFLLIAAAAALILSSRSDNGEELVRGREIQITSYVEDVSIFIDGEDTGKKAVFLEDEISYSEDKNKKFFGPFSFDSSVTVHGELNTPWGIEKSEPHEIKNGDAIDITPALFSNKETTKQLTETINGYAEQHIKSLVNQDSTILEAASENLVEDHKKLIHQNKTNGSYWKGKALGTKIDYYYAQLTKEANQYKIIRVPVEFHYKKKEYSKGMNEHEPLEELFEESMLTLIYDEKSKRWLVSEADKTSFKDSGYIESENSITTKL